MVTQYPHTLKFTTLPAATRDANGDYVVPTGTETEVSCRFESGTDSRGDNRIKTQDGQSVDYNARIYLKLGTEAPAAGDLIEVVDRYKGPCLQVYRGQLNITVFV